MALPAVAHAPWDGRPRSARCYEWGRGGRGRKILSATIIGFCEESNRSIGCRAVLGSNGAVDRDHVEVIHSANWADRFGVLDNDGRGSRRWQESPAPLNHGLVIAVR